MACAAAAAISDLRVEDVQDDNEENDQEVCEEEAEANEDDEDLTEEEHKNSLRKILNDKTNSKTKDKKLDKNVLLTTKPEAKIEIDESLFNIEDLADIEDELDKLDI